jgi:type IV pilus assembly protein PilY1
MKQLLKKTGLALLLTSSVILTAWADDVEIFFNTSEVEEVGDPLVMFALDWRPNLYSNICNIGSCDDFDPYWDGTLVEGDVGYDENLDKLSAAFSADDKADGTINFFEMLRAALRVVLNEVDGIKVGLMLNHNNENNCAGPDETDCSNGGYIAMGFESIDGDTSNGVGGDNVLLNKLALLPTPQGNDSHMYQGAELYFEFYRYLTGKNVYNGHNGYTDYGDACNADNLNDTTLPTGGCSGAGNQPDDTDVDPLISWDTMIENGSNRYITPLDASTECSGIYAINIMFGTSNQENDSDSAIVNSDFDSADGGMGFDPSPGVAAFTETIAWMYGGGTRDLADDDGTYGLTPRTGIQNVISYFLYKDVQANKVNGYAAAGGTTAAISVTSDPSAMIDELVNVFEAIKRQNSTFEAPAVTVNSYNRLTHRDELYYALFSPEQFPDWPGNLKKYKLIEVADDHDDDPSTPDIIRVTVGDDSDRVPPTAVEDSTELFLPYACSYWTDCTIDRDDPADGEADPDGDIIDWGGAAEELTGDTRNAYTDTGSSNSLSDSSNALHEGNSNITATMLGIDTSNATDMDGDTDVDTDDVAAQRERLLRLARGVDPTDTSIALKTMGDPIHARPSVIEYDGDFDNDGASPVLAIAMTTNEGMFHLINESDGSEYFSYMPQELLPLVGQINGPTYVETLADGRTADGVNRFGTYGLDASPVVWRYDYDGDGVITAADGDFVWAFLAQRRGGRNIYALDITTRTTPSLKWKIQGGVTAGFDKLGQTWSEPLKVTIIVDGVPTPVLMFGGGYDDGQDSAYTLSDDVGNAIYIVRASDGVRLKTISNSSADLNIPQMVSGIPAKLRALDVDNDHLIDHLYAVDVVGRVFRIDFETTTDTNNTNIVGGGMVAALYDSACPTGTPDEVAEANRGCQRRFYNAPDVGIMVGYPVSPYVQISVGSGYRAFPRSVPGIQNRFYTLFDPNVANSVATDDYGTGDGQQYHWTEAANLADVSSLPTDNATYDGATSAAQALLLAAGIHGWYFDLDKSLNEHVLAESVTIQGYTFFTTYLQNPDLADPCSVNLGQGRLYIVDAFNGLPIADLSNTGELLTGLDNPENADRYLDLQRTGIPSDPLVVFREDSAGNISPKVVVGSDVPDISVLGSNPYKKTWWIDVD